MKLTALLFILITSTVCVTCFEPFDDKIRFDVNWAGPVSLREGQLTMVRAIWGDVYVYVSTLKYIVLPLLLGRYVLCLTGLLSYDSCERTKHACFKFWVSKKTYKWHFRVFFSATNFVSIYVAFNSKSNSHSGSSINSKQAIARGSSFEAIHDININLVLVVNMYSHDRSHCNIGYSCCLCFFFGQRNSNNNCTHVLQKYSFTSTPLIVWFIDNLVQVNVEIWRVCERCWK